MQLKDDKIAWDIDSFESLEEICSIPHPSQKEGSCLSDEEKISHISGHFKKIMEILGLDLEDDSLKKTPQRVAKMFVKEVFSGLQAENFPDITCIENKFHHQGSDMIFTGDIQLNSFCEHHFVPMVGKAYLAYYPKKKLIGLSKINRVIRYFASRPQVQERLTAQVFESMKTILDTQDVAVAIRLKHFCVSARGVKDESSITSTFSFGGKFEKDSIAREGFMRQVSMHTS
ncbi:MAG: GTP cyclohydrolase I FolE [Chlamydiales bacterium]|nr:GTP cyclohydrolase I FolE [Chlamydiales bacterium]NCF70229.1 GTP cyclohydrolase I FolE [Chlamydiales bacterium]